MSIAPFQVQVCALDPQKPGVGETAEKITAQLEALGVEVLYDDRGEKPGFMFNDADLLGIPLRVVISPKTLADGEVEFRFRNCRDSVRIKIAEIADKISAEVADAMAKLAD